MARFVTSVQSPRKPADAFGFLADMRNFPGWDPGTLRVRQTAGDGPGPDATFDVTVAALPLPLTFRYETRRFVQPRHLELVGRHRLFTSVDRITVLPDGDGGSVVTYDADVRLAGPLALADPWLRVVFTVIGLRAARGLRQALDGEGVPTPTTVATAA
jgi:hypothetical protein